MVSMAKRRLVNDVDRGWRAEGWPAPEANAAFMSVIRAYHFLQKHMTQTLEPCGLSVIDYGTLVTLALATDGRMSLTTLAKAVMVAPTRLTYIVDRLERSGYVERRPNERDRRSIVARITSEGRRLVATANEAVAADNYGFGDMGEAELRAVVRTMLSVCDQAVASTTTKENRAQP